MGGEILRLLLWVPIARIEFSRIFHCHFKNTARRSLSLQQEIRKKQVASGGTKNGLDTSGASLMKARMRANQIKNCNEKIITVCEERLLWALRCFSFWATGVFFFAGARSLADESGDLFDLREIRDEGSLGTRVLEDWKPHPKYPEFQQKLIEITVAEWWPGQPVRIPVTLNAPSNVALLPCRNIFVANMPLRNRVATPSGVALELLKNEGVGVVLVGMGNIDAMAPAGKLHVGMKKQLLETKSRRYSTAWIWGMSQMRGLTAAEAERNHFKPEKVISSGGSKRGIASAVAGIHDDRFTGIAPIVAPPLGNAGVPSEVIGAGPEWIGKVNRQFLVSADDGVRRSLEARDGRRRSTRLTLEEVVAQGWTKSDIDSLGDRVWNASRIAARLPTVEARSLDFFYNVGTNDSVTPALLELGKRYPKFPIYIVPGGQHGGPGDAGFTRRVTIQPEVLANLEAFSRYHFFGEGRIPENPEIFAKREGSYLVITVRLPEYAATADNRLSWSFDRHPPYTLAFEYDEWESAALESAGKGLFQARIAIPESVQSIQYLSTHKQLESSRPFAFSSPLRERKLD